MLIITNENRNQKNNKDLFLHEKECVALEYMKYWLFDHIFPWPKYKYSFRTAILSSLPPLVAFLDNLDMPQCEKPRIDRLKWKLIFFCSILEKYVCDDSLWCEPKFELTFALAKNAVLPKQSIQINYTMSQCDDWWERRTKLEKPSSKHNFPIRNQTEFAGASALNKWRIVELYFESNDQRDGWHRADKCTTARFVI